MAELKELSVLLLEDNPEFAQNTMETLKLYFKNVSHATSIKEALKLYENYRVDVIISDIKVEDGNGLDFIKRIRTHDKQIPISILSAHKDEEFLFSAIPLHILSYDLKPLSYDSFMALLKKISTNFQEREDVRITDILRYSYATKELYEDTKVISLTKKEALFIELLLKRKNGITTHAMIQRDVYDGNIMSEAAIKNLLLRLRKKTKTGFISTVHNFGYKFLAEK
jgi:DNA-binding response OmpR family regulator